MAISDVVEYYHHNLDHFFYTLNPIEIAGACANANDIALYRVWRPFGVSNHRFTTDRAIVDEMVAKGWIDEGTRMCVLAPH